MWKVVIRVTQEKLKTLFRVLLPSKICFKFIQFVKLKESAVDGITTAEPVIEVESFFETLNERKTVEI